MTVSKEMESGQVVIGTQENPWSGRNNENAGPFTIQFLLWKVEHALSRSTEAEAAEGSWLGLGLGLGLGSLMHL